MNNFTVIHPSDNVMIALFDMKAGDVVNNITLKHDIIKGHKIALRNIEANEYILKYGVPIGRAKEPIAIGEHVHTHNVVTTLSDIIEYNYVPKFEDVVVKSKPRNVNVYKRKNGNFGIRNELWIVPTVGCVIAQVRQMIDTFNELYQPVDIDGVFTFNHPYGCSQMGDDHENTKIALQNITKHPNAGAVLVVGLGCENNQVKAFKESLGEYDEDRVQFLITQDVEDEIEIGVSMMKDLYEIMRKDKREEAPLSALRIGLECGGSDGFSGITANPLLGRFSDYIIENGGTTVLTEVPEMFGAETILMQRAENKEVYEDIVNLINDFKNYYKRHNQVIYENPSPGNKNGGITTLEDKSLGCTQKAGASKVTAVLGYTDIISKPGLNLLSAPGNDLVATTALGMTGCQLVLFTTGRGTPYGGFIPTMKISTNSDLAKRKANWIDFDAGRLVGELSMDELLEEFIDAVIDVINGKPTRNEINNFREIAIFKSGVTL